MTSWELWTLPRHVLTYVLVVELIAAGAVAVAVDQLPITGTDWVRFGILAACALVHVDISRSVERVREINSGLSPYLDTKAIWSFAAVVVLPPSLACAMVVLTYTWFWVRLWRRPHRRPLYRTVFSTATVLIGTEAAAAVLAFGPIQYPGLPVTVAGLIVLAVAGLLRWFLNYALVAIAILITSPNMRANQVFHNLDERVLEAGSFGLGVIAAALVTYNPLLLTAVLLSVAAMNRIVLLPQFRRAASTDVKTGLNTAAWWHRIAEQAVERSEATGTPLAMLMLDLDHFKRVNDTYGHPAGDEVLHAVGRAISAEIRDYDTAGRWGGEEFAVLAPDVDTAELEAIAERIRHRVHDIDLAITTSDGPATISDLSVSIGGACYPTSTVTSLEDLILAADTALYAAKQAGRDRTRLAPAPPSLG